MNVFFYGTCAAGFGVLKSKFDKDMAEFKRKKWVTDYRLSDLGNNEVMCCMNVTDMDALGAFMSDPAEAQWDKDNGAVYKAYSMQEMGQHFF